MESEQRLHPWSILFAVGKYFKEFALTGVFILVGSTASGRGLPVWFVLPVVGVALLAAVARLLSFRFRYDPDQLVLRWGFLFRTERHIPYGRIQNIDAVQNVVHRALGVMTVQIQTGSGNKAEATLSVVPPRVLAEMRERVFRRAGAEVGPSGALASGAPAEVAPAATLRLSDRELLLAGFILSRGLVVVGAIIGLGYELGLTDGFIEAVLGDRDAGGSVVREVGRSLADGTAFPVEGALVGVAMLLVGLLVLRVVAMTWRAIQWHEFQVTRIGDDIHTSYGMLTRVSATIPARRVQSVTIEERWLHRVFKRVSIRITSAAGIEGAEAREEKWLAPLVRRDSAPDLIAELLPEFRLGDPEWQPVHPRAWGRKARRGILVWAVLILPFWALLEWRAGAIFAVLAMWNIWWARQYVRHLHWAETGTSVGFRHGWITRLTTVVRFDRIQSVVRTASPWDRRADMAHVEVDVAGNRAGRQVGIRYLHTRVADELAARLDRRAGETEFSW